MDASGAGGGHIRVAGGADLVGTGRQELSVGGGMGIVASGAVTLFQRSMHKGPGELVLEGRMAIEAELAGGSRFQLEFELIVLGGVGERANDQGKKKHR